ncbi:MAG: hypothetical protein RDV48_22115 [Candidatus Eremiobacteraeota bacterium]|nr:hypothetical protein [Candidatus Eremiobacteraeota bacterium]
MAKYGFDDSELQKLFADAGAAVQKAKVAPKAEESARAEPEENLQEAEGAKSAAPQEAAAPAPPPAAQHPPKPAPAAAPSGRSFQIVAGTQDDGNLTGTTSEGTSAVIPWKGIKSLAIGRVENAQIVVWIYGNAVYFVSDKNVAFKGLIPQMAFSATENWRGFVNMMTQRTGLAKDPGIQAFQTPGGLIPKYPSQDDLIRHVRSLM